MTAPRVSVILATYNWSNVLRHAITSALRQTFDDFELLVVGDACTDDSAAVVAAFDNPRVRWFNLPENAGSQFGPNNAGLAGARGEYIAYLGQDDVWLPAHLESLVEVLDTTGADLACAVAILYGPAGTDVRGVTGLWDARPGEPLRHIPPSSMMHRREVVAHIGLWKDHRHIRLPPDYEFISRMWEHRHAFARTRQVTTLKFTAAWRPDAYAARNADDQAACLNRMLEDPHFAERELMEVVKSYAAGTAVDVGRPPDAPPGSILARAKAFKGVDLRLSAEERTDRLRFDFDEVLPGFEWHGIERDDRYGTFQWCGPGTRASLHLPLTIDRELDILIRVIHAVIPEILDTLRLEVNGDTIPLERHADPAGSNLFAGRIPAPVLARREGAARLVFIVDRTIEPRVLDPSSDDRRRLGLAFNWIDISPAPTEPAVDVDSTPTDDHERPIDASETAQRGN